VSRPGILAGARSLTTLPLPEIRALLLRYVVPAVAAILLVVLVGVPLLDHLLTDWFRADVQVRAQLVMTSIADQLGKLLDERETGGASAYLARVAGDERLLGILVCGPTAHRVIATKQLSSVVQCSEADLTGNGPASTLVRSGSGLLEVSHFALRTPAGVQYSVLLAQDLAFVARRRSVARYLTLAATVVAAVALALLAAFAARLLLNRSMRQLLVDISRRRFLDDAQSPRETRPVLRRVRQLLTELEAKQRLEVDFRENWTPQALQQVVREQLDSGPILVVSNREPYIHNAGENGTPEVSVPASGMVTAMEPVMRACSGSGTWIAHGSGEADRAVVDGHDHVRVPPEDPTYTLRRIWLSQEEEEGYYYGFANEGLWALCHLAYVRPEFREADWQQYVSVNEKFAAVTKDESTTDDPVILIQDYHLALLPQLIRARLPHATIALFWHIPWPNAETFGVCPWKRELLLHMLSADILGFHTVHHCRNFLESLDRFIECNINHESMRVTLQRHVCRVRAYPISIEWPPHWLARAPAPAAAREAVVKRFNLPPDVRIGVGVERWDFTKGIIERFHALEALFDKYPKWLGRVSFLQVAAPSRSKLPAYQELQRHTLAEMKRINERFARDGWVPIVLVSRHQEPQQVFELYRAADFCLVNSLHDGMNLVAKEFVAAREDEEGVLILSTFAGASRELAEALLINPFDVPGTADAIVAALEMPREQRRLRMRLMRRTVGENNVYRWAGRMLVDVARIRQRQQLEDWMAAG
jgi:trehalose 6-phosphate synthase